jgi:sugar phosphate permease
MRFVESEDSMRATTDIYRGWWVLAGLFLIYAASNGILMHTLPLTYPALIDEFGWDQIEVTLPATVFFVVSALASPPIGALLDRYSARLIMSVGAVCMVVGLAGFSLVTELWHLVAVYIVFALSISMCGLVSTMLVLTRWFNRLRGRATGLLLMASSLGASVFPLILGASMKSAGWRYALMQFAVIAAVMTAIPVLFLIRNRPADVGLSIDGRTPPIIPEDSGSGPAAALNNGPTLRQAVSQPRFYLIAFATGAIWFTIISLVQHQSIYLAKDIGIARDLLPSVFSTFFAFSVAGKFGFGWLSDRFDKGNTLSGSVMLLIISLLILRFLDRDNLVSLYAYAAIAGIGFSGAFTTIQLFIASFYAGHAYGKILAVLTLFDTMAGALGTRVIGEIRAAFGSYTPAIDLMIATCVAGVACIVIVKKIQSSPTAPSTQWRTDS